MRICKADSNWPMEDLNRGSIIRGWRADMVIIICLSTWSRNLLKHPNAISEMQSGEFLTLHVKAIKHMLTLIRSAKVKAGHVVWEESLCCLRSFANVIGMLQHYTF
jgi:hypothetical protein